MSEYKYLTNENDIENFMKLYGYFHDSCIKELKYESGMYVNSNLSMQPINDKRNLNIIFQRQFSTFSTIEMVFEGLVCLHLNPSSSDMDGIINSAYMCIKDGEVLWLDSDNFNKEIDSKELNKLSNITWIKAENVKYRIMDNYLGEDQIYK